MRIKIIGDNNCARATRHLLRMAGFAVVEFLPVEAVTRAPHGGYAITISYSARAANIAQATVPSSGHTPEPAFAPDYSSHGQPALRFEEASTFANATADASSPYRAEAEVLVSVGARHAVPLQHASIHFDSVDSLLETAVLRHVAQLAAAPVIVDRPGGIVHSDRELRIVLPSTGDRKADDAAAVAVEFGVLRGLLDIVFPQLAAAKADTSAVASGSFRSAGKKKWWRFGLALIVGALLTFVADAHASRVHLQGVRIVGDSRSTGFSLCSPDVGKIKGAQAEACATKPALSFSRVVGTRVTNGAYLRLAAASVPEPAQGQFSTGQQTKITDGANTMVVDPCKAQTKLYVSINQTANTQLVAGTSSKKIYVCSIHVVVAAATNVALVEGTGSVCGTGTAGVSGFGGATAATGWNFGANGGIVLGNGDSSVGGEGTSGDNLCVFNSSAGQVSGGISYVVQ